VGSAVSQMVTRNVGDVVSEIKMTRTAFGGGLLVVEGPTDAGFFAKRVVNGPKQIVIAGTKVTAIGAVVTAYATGVVGVVGVVDDDYDSLCGVATPSPHVLRTETRDLETLLVSSPALDALVHEVADAGKVQALEQAEGCSIRQALANRTLVFGKLRLLNRREGWNLNFVEDFRPWRFADKAQWVLDETAVITLASAKSGATDAAIRTALAAIVAPTPYLLMHGRDTLTILQIGLNERLGDESFSVENLCRMLRLAFSDAMAANCQLFHAIRAWEVANPPFRILA
jgi:hypothetical protein